MPRAGGAKTLGQSNGQEVNGVRKSDFVQSFERGLRVIKAFDADHPQLALSDVARITGLTRAAARRFLLTLAEIGYVRIEGGVFSLRPRVLELGSAYVSGLRLPEVAEAHIKTLVGNVNESVAVAVLDDLDIVHVVTERPFRILGLTTQVGSRLPAHWTSMGRVLLADMPPETLDDTIARIDFNTPTPTPAMVSDERSLREILDRVREQGWAVVDQEVEVGLRAVAVPLRNAEGVAVASMNIAAFSPQTTMSELVRRFLPLLSEAARAIETDLEHLHDRGIDAVSTVGG